MSRLLVAVASGPSLACAPVRKGPLVGSVETIIRKNRVTYRGVPWDAVSGKRGPTRSFERETDAYAYMRAWERNNDGVATDAGLPERRRKRILVSDYATDFALIAPGESTTKRDRRSVARRVAEEFKGVYLDELNYHRIAKWDLELAEKYAAGTRRKRVGFLSKMCTAAIEDGYLRENPCTKIERAPRVSKRIKSEFTELEMERILRWLPEYLKVVALLACNSGMRAGEICGLTWKHVDLDNALVHVRDVRLTTGEIRGYTKGKTHRTIPLSPRTVTALKAHREFVSTGPNDFVACNEHFDPMYTNWLATVWYRKMAQYRKHIEATTGQLVAVPRFHDLRHYAAHDLVRRGVHVRVLQEFLGHKDLSTTQIYMPDVTVEAMAAAMRAPVLVAV